MNDKYDPTWQSVPVPGISSGMLASGMNFDYLPPHAPIMLPQPPPSPLQQYIGLGNMSKGGGMFGVGHPVKIVHMTSVDSQFLNGLVGDIVNVTNQDNYDGTSEVLFDVRCPLENRSRWWDNIMEKDHGRARPSSLAMMCAPMNVKTLGPDQTLYRDNAGGPPPYVLLKKVPSEKLEPQGDGTQGHGFRRPAPPGVEMLPTQTGQPVWASPPPGMLPPDTFDSRVVSPGDPRFRSSMMDPQQYAMARSGMGMPPTMPFDSMPGMGSMPNMGMPGMGMPGMGMPGMGMPGMGMPGTMPMGMPPGSMPMGMGGPRPPPGSFGAVPTPPGSFVGRPPMM